MPQTSAAPKCKRLVALCPAPMHAEFLDIAERTGESAALILRSLVGEAIERARRGEPIVLRLAPDVSGFGGGF